MAGLWDISNLCQVKSGQRDHAVQLLQIADSPALLQICPNYLTPSKILSSTPSPLSCAPRYPATKLSPAPIVSEIVSTLSTFTAPARPRRRPRENSKWRTALGPSVMTNVVEFVEVKSSFGSEGLTRSKLCGETWTIDLTLSLACIGRLQGMLAIFLIS